MNKEADVIIKEMAVGPIMANCFILGCEKTKQAAVIDPGDEADKILMSLAESELTLKYIINTHGHFDHVGGNKRLKEVTGAEILIHGKDAPMLGHQSSAASMFGVSSDDSPPPDRFLEDGDTVRFGEIELSVLHTPGHSPGGIALVHDKECVFVGDTLFMGSIGRTDLPGGDYETLISSIKTKLFPLGNNITVYTGHGPATTISREKRYNPFLS